MEIRTPRDLGIAIRHARTRRGLSQREVADRAGVSRPWLSEFESGKPRVELASVLRVVDALEVRLRLIDADPTPPSDGVNLDELIDEHLDDVRRQP